MATYRRRTDRGTWEIDLGRDANGRRVRRQLPARTPEREVKAIIRRATLERSVSRIFGAPATSPPLAHWCADYCAWHELQFPDSHYRVRQIIEQHIVTAMGSISLDQLTAQHIEAWKATRARAVKAASVVKELRVLRAILNRAVRLGMLARSPANAVDAPRITDSKAPLFYSAEQMARLYAASGFAPWHAPAWRLLANTGMRRGEALAARKDWIMPGRALNIQSTGEERTKSGEWRSIPLSTGALDAIEALSRIVEGPHLLPRVHRVAFSHAAAKCMARAGLAGSLHTLRHTYGSTLVMAGVPIRVVQRYMGHAHVSTTEIYAHLAPGFAADAAVRMAI